MKELPIVDSSNQFHLYKGTQYKGQDIIYQYFNNNPLTLAFKEPIEYTHFYQYLPYNTINFAAIGDILDIYFEPSHTVSNIITNMEQKYSLNYSNICVLFFRGNDKLTEIERPTYNDYIIRAQKIKAENPDIQFLIQSDETEFIKRMLEEFPNSIIFHDEIRHMEFMPLSIDKIDYDKNLDFSLNYLAITIIMSRCKFVICNSGNCSIWICLYRKSSENVDQIITKCY